MSTETHEGAKPDSGLELSQDSDSAASRTTESVFLKRRRRRRLDLRTLAGTLRESAKLYREVAEGRVSLGEGEVRSRMLVRHRDILNSIEQNEALVKIQESLAAIRGERDGLLIEDGRADEDEVNT